MTATAPTQSHDDLAAWAADDDERAFVDDAIAFLAARVARRAPQLLRWGDCDEGLTIFHETTGEEERREADAAQPDTSPPALRRC